MNFNEFIFYIDETAKTTPDNIDVLLWNEVVVLCSDEIEKEKMFKYFTPMKEIAENFEEFYWLVSEYFYDNYLNSDKDPDTIDIYDIILKISEFVDIQ